MEILLCFLLGLQYHRVMALEFVQEFPQVIFYRVLQCKGYLSCVIKYRM